MSVQELYQEIKTLSEREREELLSRLLSEKDLVEEVERRGVLHLTERGFDFWSDPREDLYQDYARPVK